MPKITDKPTASLQLPISMEMLYALRKESASKKMSVKDYAIEQLKLAIRWEE